MTWTPAWIDRDLRRMLDGPLATDCVIHRDRAPGASRTIRGFIDALPGTAQLGETPAVRQSWTLIVDAADAVDLSIGDRIEVDGEWHAVARAPETDGTGVSTVTLSASTPTAAPPDRNATAFLPAS